MSFSFDTPENAFNSFVLAWDLDPVALIELHRVATGQQEQVDPSYLKDLQQCGFINADGTLPDIVQAIAEECIGQEGTSWKLYPMPPAVQIFMPENPLIVTFRQAVADCSRANAVPLRIGSDVNGTLLPDTFATTDAVPEIIDEKLLKYLAFMRLAGADVKVISLGGGNLSQLRDHFKVMAEGRIPRLLAQMGLDEKRIQFVLPALAYPHNKREPVVTQQRFDLIFDDNRPTYTKNVSAWMHPQDSDTSAMLEDFWQQIDASALPPLETLDR